MMPAPPSEGSQWTVNWELSLRLSEQWRMETAQSLVIEQWREPTQKDLIIKVIIIK